jgi:hypothetical protein
MFAGLLCYLKCFYYDIPVGPEPVTYRANGPAIPVRAVLRDSCADYNNMLSRVAKQ